MNNNERKRWSWSPLVGIKYDGMPVGLIGVLTVVTILVLAAAAWVFVF